MERLIHRMARADKVAAVAELTESFRQSNAAVLTEYRGLTVAELKELRRALATDARYAIVKNTLTKLAVRDAGVAELESLLEGPSAIAFVTGDPINVAKGIRDFARNHPALIVKGGLFDGRPITADELRKLADLESREVLLAKLAGAMKASLQQAVSLFAAPLSQAARVIGALEAKAQADPSVLGGGAGTPAPATQEAPATEAATDATDTEAVATEAAPTEAVPAEAAPTEAAPTEAAAETAGPAETPSDSAPAVEESPDTSATTDPGEQAQAVADAVADAPADETSDAENLASGTDDDETSTESTS
jgi:large subunit ribosomal protein L10